MKGPFSIWAFFGLTLWIDIITHIIFPKKERTIDPYNPIREVSVTIPVHKEPKEYVEYTIEHLYRERYPLKNVIIIGDSFSSNAKEAVNELSKIYKNLLYYESPDRSKAKKINNLVKNKNNILGEFIYVRDCRVKGEIDCIEKMVSYFNTEKVAAVTSYGRVSIPKNPISRAYHYGKSWINEIGRFRKNAQEKRGAVFVICGASTIFRKKILEKIQIPCKSKTEDTYYTWILQKKGYKIRVADDACVSAPDVDGQKFDGINGQIKQSYRWSTGTIQCMYNEGKDILKNKKLAYTTIFPGFLESLMYTIPLFFIPLLFFISPGYALGFLIGDTVFSLLGTLIILPKKFFKTLIHYPEIVFFKYVNAMVFLVALVNTTAQALLNKEETWSNEWIPPETRY
ncbi:MAG: glycosyltransferase family 2 protein [Candidatus Pacearchaeota archaeon]